MLELNLWFVTQEDNKCKVTLKYPHFFPVTRKCRNAETRKTIETAYQARCMKENTEILEKLVELRQRQADLLGYKTHASYVQEVWLSNQNIHMLKWFVWNRKLGLNMLKINAIFLKLRMAKNPEKVKSFYESLVPKLQPIWKKEKAEILKLKEEEVSSS